MRLLITGGAGFVGSSLAVGLARRHPDWEITAADNLYRRGSELNLPRLRQAGVRFEHADVRLPADLERLGPIQALVECSAEPSALAGRSDTSFVVPTNLFGAYHCFELAARHGAQVIFLSTSRVYPVETLAGLAYSEGETRFELASEQHVPGASAAGIAEDFPLEGSRTLYGATKLAAELLLREYAENFGIPTTVDRCGVISGPWQMGGSEQGVFAHWAIGFLRGRELRYIGYGGAGKQVRDVLHVDDLVDLLELQLLAPAEWSGRTFNVGGGLEGSLSLREATEICRELTDAEIEPGSVAEERPGDVPIYVSDCRALHEHTDWRPRRGPRQVLADILSWAGERDSELDFL